MGAFNALQQSDAHAYWNSITGTNWFIHSMSCPSPRIPGPVGRSARHLRDGEIGKLQSIVPGSGQRREERSSPRRRRSNLPRDPDKFDGTVDAQREFRQRGIPSGLANEIFLDVYVRRASFEPGEEPPAPLFDAYAASGARRPNGDGIISAPEETSTRQPTASPTTRASTWRRRFSSASP